MSTKQRPLSKKDVKNKKSDVNYFKMSMMFFIASAAVMFLARLSFTDSTQLWFYRACRNPVYFGVLAALFAISLLFFGYKKLIKKEDEKLKYIASINFVALTGYAFFASLFFGHANNPTTALMIGTVMLIVLYYVYYIYRRDFFVFSIINSIFCALLWMFAFKLSTVYIIVKIALVIAMAALAIYANSYVKAYGNKKDADGKKSMKKNEVSFSSIAVYASLLVFTALLFLPHFYPLSNTINIIIMLVVYVLAGVYYTINLIREA